MKTPRSKKYPKYFYGYIPGVWCYTGQKCVQRDSWVDNLDISHLVPNTSISMHGLPDTDPSTVQSICGDSHFRAIRSYLKICLLVITYTSLIFDWVITISDKRAAYRDIC